MIGASPLPIASSAAIMASDPQRSLSLKPLRCGGTKRGGCERRCNGGLLQCEACVRPPGMRTCPWCNSVAWHNVGYSTCNLCRCWVQIRDAHKRRRLPVSTLTEPEFWQLVHSTVQCEDTGHVFVDREPNALLRKSIDRIDNEKGYSRDNVRCVTWKANCLRRRTPIHEWRAACPLLFPR